MPFSSSAQVSSISDGNMMGWSLEHKDGENSSAGLDQMFIKQKPVVISEVMVLMGTYWSVLNIWQAEL